MTAARRTARPSSLSTSKAASALCAVYVSKMPIFSPYGTINCTEEPRKTVRFDLPPLSPKSLKSDCCEGDNRNNGDNSSHDFQQASSITSFFHPGIFLPLRDEDLSSSVLTDRNTTVVISPTPPLFPTSHRPPIGDDDRNMEAVVSQSQDCGSNDPATTLPESSTAAKLYAATSSWATRDAGTSSHCYNATPPTSDGSSNAMTTHLSGLDQSCQQQLSNFC